jgi:protein-S-isoprenylcysteine O-methyltransferase Ste14
VGVFVLGFAVFVVLAGYCLWAVHHEYETRRRLSAATIGAAWALHAVHAALIAGAAWISAWPLPIGGLLGVAVGVALLLEGVGFAFAGAIGFGSLRRMSGLRDDTLVRSGAYRYSRNPQSVGWMLALLGVACLGRSGLAVALVVLFWVVLDVYVRIEERHLERLYGDDYRRYREATPRYLGRPRRG